jgi:hypothetical protein
MNMSDKITIAQALRRIKKLKGQIAEHSQRAQAGVSYDQSKPPAFRFQEAVAAVKAAQKELVDLQSRTAVANAKATISDGAETITHAEAIRRLQEIKGEIAFLKGLNLRNESVKDRQQEWDDTEMKHVVRVTEVTWVSDLSEKDRDTQVKALQDRFEVLNNTLEDRNHKVAV